jgi:transketolase
VEAWKYALTRTDGPVALIFTRQNLPVIDRSVFAGAENLLKGAYVLADPKEGKPEVVLIATGSEVSLIIEARERLEKKGVKARIVSMPSWELFEMQPGCYKDEVLPPSIRARVTVEAAVSLGWRKYAGEMGRIVAHDRFGASAPYEVLMEEFGFTTDRVVREAELAIKSCR